MHHQTSSLEGLTQMRQVAELQQHKPLCVYRVAVALTRPYRTCCWCLNIWFKEKSRPRLATVKDRDADLSRSFFRRISDLLSLSELCMHPALLFNILASPSFVKVGRFLRRVYRRVSFQRLKLRLAMFCWIFLLAKASLRNYVNAPLDVEDVLEKCLNLVTLQA